MEPPITDAPTYTILLNSTSLKYSHCQYRYHMAVRHGWIDAETSEYLTFGKAVHLFMEQRAHGMEMLDAMQLAIRSYKGNNVGQLTKTLTAAPNPAAYYVSADGRKYIEYKFKIYWKTIVYEGCHFNIYIVGTFDLVKMYNDGYLCINDYKTARAWNEAAVFGDYANSVQMQFYAWVAHRFAHHIFDLPAANAAEQNKLFVQITGAFVSKTPVVWRSGAPIQYSFAQFEEFERTLNYHITANLLPAWLTPAKTGLVNDTCDKCPFSTHCHAYSPELATLTTMKQTPYDPTTW